MKRLAILIGAAVLATVLPASLALAGGSQEKPAGTSPAMPGGTVSVLAV